MRAKHLVACRTSYGTQGNERKVNQKKVGGPNPVHTALERKGKRDEGRGEKFLARWLFVGQALHERRSRYYLREGATHGPSAVEHV